MEITEVHVLDTHGLIWHLEGNPKLGGNAKTVLDDPQSRLNLPIIALAEAIDIVRKGRTSITAVADLLRDVFADARIEIEPLTVEILLEAENALGVPEMHDRLITATALNLEKQGFQVAVLTKDASIADSKLVKIIW